MLLVRGKEEDDPVDPVGDRVLQRRAEGVFPWVQADANVTLPTFPGLPQEGAVHVDPPSAKRRCIGVEDVLHGPVETWDARRPPPERRVALPGNIGEKHHLHASPYGGVQHRHALDVVDAQPCRVQQRAVVRSRHIVTIATAKVDVSSDDQRVDLDHEGNAVANEEVHNDHHTGGLLVGLRYALAALDPTLVNVVEVQPELPPATGCAHCLPNVGVGVLLHLRQAILEALQVNDEGRGA
mmetsp:Transcript_68115/g.175589  ORF Transcript_68115/g.175589 Transcript_68115/m.175589 type:complete len:239 (+) Transcript_68115:1861-2577(+)